MSEPAAEPPWKVIALALAAAMLLTVGLGGWRLHSEHSDLSEARALTAAGVGAEAAARSAVVRMTSYDYASIDKDFAWVDDAGTAKFRKQYVEVSAPIKKLVLQLKAHAEGNVVAAAPEVRDRNHVTVLMFVDQTLTNPSDKTPGLDQPRVTMTMVRQDGRWLVDEVKLSNLTNS